ncbi:hypothetical protein RFN28_02380 [Mesorhizobium sp. VK24D]|uniref:Uncharacterized protein n=1 Tax=Mesorhizobium album TaxID=3072314 RepID=A0ABU4XTC4_9HYPH|nr:hypothetical protein [Mesorhizobium sp. VK24D]MDX8477323.1 hypothetical protein [Mesorhizobium sp. VK24D]
MSENRKLAAILAADVVKVLPYKNPADFERVVGGLRKAGVVQ